MRDKVHLRLVNGRIRDGYYGSTDSFWLTGAFLIQGPCGGKLTILANTGSEDSKGWEHVSVSLKHRTPNWQEMCFVKDLFWAEDECVVQFHPPKSEYVNHHPNCLHLWRHITDTFPMPPSMLVGPKT